MPREVTDAEGLTWTCIQAFSGLSESSDADTDKQQAAQVEGTDDRYHVVCTPSGGAQSVRLALPANWEEECADEDLLRDIEAQRQHQSA